MNSKSLIIVHSYHHMNTLAIAKTMAQTLLADVLMTDQVDIDTLTDYELIGFGAGIDSAKHYPELLELAKSLHRVNKKHAFIFSTSAVMGDKKIAKDHKTLRGILTSKGYIIVDEFACKGFNTNLFLKYFGGMNKGRPNQDDHALASQFAVRLQDNFN